MLEIAKRSILTPEKRKEFLSVIIPAYNESVRIIPTIRKVDQYCNEWLRGFEIIVVNDGSKDDTRDIVNAEKDKITSLRYEEYKRNRGKGYAIRHGVSVSAGDVILVSDADLSTPIEEVEKLLLLYDQGYDVVIGSRALKESDIVVRQPWWRELMGKTFNVFVRLLFSVDFKDTQCGFKLFRGDTGRKIFRTALIDRFAYDVEILCLARKAGFGIKEVPITWLNSPASKVNPIKDSLQMVKDLIKMKLRKLSI
jgi:dolichyl-phosphate beta-glucosyltransferase